MRMRRKIITAGNELITPPAFLQSWGEHWFRTIIVFEFVFIMLTVGSVMPPLCSYASAPYYAQNSPSITCQCLGWSIWARDCSLTIYNVRAQSPMDDINMISLALCSNVWLRVYSCSRWINMKIWGGVPSFDRNLSKYLRLLGY